MSGTQQEIRFTGLHDHAEAWWTTSEETINGRKVSCVRVFFHDVATTVTGVAGIKLSHNGQPTICLETKPVDGSTPKAPIAIIEILGLTGLNEVRLELTSVNSRPQYMTARYNPYGVRFGTTNASQFQLSLTAG